jgi:carbonic anhydrase
VVKIPSLLDGYREFYNGYFKAHPELFNQLAQGQSPKTLVIACSDSRVDPSIIFNTKPGDIFVIRNVANLVPPYQPIDESYHGTSAAVEFAVCALQVENIIVMGHEFCAGVQAAVSDNLPNNAEFNFVRQWVNMAEEIREQRCSCQSEYEEEAIKVSLRNLMTFPWIQEKVEQGTLTLYGWHFSISSGSLKEYDNNLNKFIKIE